jgi:hypothetical protein
MYFFGGFAARRAEPDRLPADARNRYVSALPFIFHLGNTFVVFGQRSEKILQVPLDDLNPAFQRIEQPEI